MTADRPKPDLRVGLVAMSILVAALVVAGALAWPEIAKLWRADAQKDWYRRALGYERQGNMVEATRAFWRAEAAGLSTAEFYNRWGALEMNTLQGFAAEAHFHRALDIDPSHGPARANLAELYRRRGWDEQAAQQFSLAAALLPDSTAQLYVVAGNLYEGLGKRDRAVEMYRYSLAARRGYLPALEGLLRLGEPLPGK